MWLDEHDEWVNAYGEGTPAALERMLRDDWVMREPIFWATGKLAQGKIVSGEAETVLAGVIRAYPRDWPEEDRATFCEDLAERLAARIVERGGEVRPVDRFATPAERVLQVLQDSGCLAVRRVA